MPTDVKVRSAIRITSDVPFMEACPAQVAISSGSPPKPRGVLSSVTSSVLWACPYLRGRVDAECNWVVEVS